MLSILGVIFAVDCMLGMHLLARAARVDFKRKDLIDQHYWCVIGIAIVFHAVMLVYTLVFLYIHRIVHAAM